MDYLNLPSCTLLHVPLSLHKQLQDFPFVLHIIYPTSPRVIVYKRHKVVVTSNRYRVGRYPNIVVNIIQNSLGTMSHRAESHFDLLSDDAMFRISICRYWHVLVNLALLEVGKTFSPACLSLKCQSRVQSSTEFVEVITCHVTVLPFK